MIMGSVSGTKTAQVHLAHSYSETCGDNTGEIPGPVDLGTIFV